VDAMKPLLRPGGGLHLDSSTSGFGSGGSSTGGVSVTATIQSSSSHNSRQHQVRSSYCLIIHCFHPYSTTSSHVRRGAHLLSMF
jgi:hypothetical protein